MANVNQEIAERGILIMTRCHTGPIEIAIEKEIEEKFHEALERATTSMTLSLTAEGRRRMSGSTFSTCVMSMDKPPLLIFTTLSASLVALQITSMAGQISEALASQESEMDTSLTYLVPNCWIKEGNPWVKLKA